MCHVDGRYDGDLFRVPGDAVSVFGTLVVVSWPLAGSRRTGGRTLRKTHLALLSCRNSFDAFHDHFEQNSVCAWTSWKDRGRWSCVLVLAPGTHWRFRFGNRNWKKTPFFIRRTQPVARNSAWRNCFGVDLSISNFGLVCRASRFDHHRHWRNQCRPPFEIKNSNHYATCARSGSWTCLMNSTRRAALKAIGLLGATLPFTACERLISGVTHHLGQSIPDSLTLPNSSEIDLSFHLLSRAAYGPWPGDLDRVRAIGSEAWIEEQLSPETIDDTSCDLRARRFETIWHEPGTCYEYKKPLLREEITRHTLLRALYSKRQLLEVMVGFWTDHLNINLEKGDCIYLKPADDRLVIRAHALGKFSDLIRASATSPAMLVYLDGKENKKKEPGDVPNENYARELLELHTLGVDGGYTQTDVYEAARSLTGWRLRTGWRKGTVYFDPSLHDDGEKRVLGKIIPAGDGERDVDRLVETACNHPATARHIATKLVRRFVSEDPPASLVQRLSTVFTSTGGDIKSLLRAMLTSDEFKLAKGPLHSP